MTSNVHSPASSLAASPFHGYSPTELPQTELYRCWFHVSLQFGVRGENSLQGVYPSNATQPKPDTIHEPPSQGLQPLGLSDHHNGYQAQGLQPLGCAPPTSRPPRSGRLLHLRGNAAVPCACSASRVNRISPMPSRRGASSGASAGSDIACTPWPCTTRTTLAAQALPAVMWSLVSAVRGMGDGYQAGAEGNRSCHGCVSRERGK